MEKVVEGVAWGLRDHGSPIEKDLSELEKLGEALAKATKERKSSNIRITNYFSNRRV